MHVKDLMTADVATVRADASLKDAARILIERKISGLPVVDESGMLAGIVSEGDVLHQESIRQPATTLKSFFKGQEDPALTVGEAMTKKVRTIGPESDHTEAARLMESAGVKRLPVVDGEGRVIGIISRSDILRVFARDDSEIVKEIRADVLERILWLNPDTVEVAVDEGKVLLKGTVPTKSDLRILEEMARRIDGVVSVDSGGIDYETDDTRGSDGPVTGDAPRANW